MMPCRPWQGGHCVGTFQCGYRSSSERRRGYTCTSPRRCDTRRSVSAIFLPDTSSIESPGPPCTMSPGSSCCGAVMGRARGASARARDGRPFRELAAVWRAAPRGGSWAFTAEEGSDGGPDVQHVGKLTIRLGAKIDPVCAAVDSSMLCSCGMSLAGIELASPAAAWLPAAQQAAVCLWLHGNVAHISSQAGGPWIVWHRQAHWLDACMQRAARSDEQ